MTSFLIWLVSFILAMAIIGSISLHNDGELGIALLVATFPIPIGLWMIFSKVCELYIRKRIKSRLPRYSVGSFILYFMKDEINHSKWNNFVQGLKLVFMSNKKFDQLARDFLEYESE